MNRAYIADMFAEFLSRLIDPDPDPLGDSEARLALAALLVRIARADGSYDSHEIARIDKILSSRFRLGQAEAASLRAEAEVFEAEAPDTVRFTRAIKDAVPYEDRKGVVEAMWSVVLADGARAVEEDAILRLTASLLGVNDRDSALARQKASDS